MKVRLSVALVLLFFGLVFHGCERTDGDFQKGWDAYNKQDYATALKEWRPLAEQGNADAQNNLGSMYALGTGVPQDLEEAVKWVTLAAEQGNAEAQYRLGVMYYLGNGVPEDDREAAKWYALAAEQGYPDAQSNLGAMYASGKGVPKDYVYAYMWFSIASSLGYEIGMEVKERLREEMTRSQVEEGQQLSRKCLDSNYEDCK